jgi:Ca2+-binding EF-hand superfamily protein
MKSIRSGTTKSSPSKRNILFDLSEEQKQEIKEAFDVLDVEKVNAIPFKDLNIILRALGFEVTKEELSKISNEFFKGEDDVLKYEEFYEIMQKKIVIKNNQNKIINFFYILFHFITFFFSLFLI